VPITRSQIQFTSAAGKPLASGRLNNVFGNTTTNAGTSYAWIEVRNLSETLTLSAVKAWLTLDNRGGAFAIAYDNVSGIVVLGAAWDAVDATDLTYSSPTTMATGISLGTLTPETKARLFLRRTLSGASAATPESNRVWVGGTSPL
jgi:hypothetical protein